MRTMTPQRRAAARLVLSALALAACVAPLAILPGCAPADPPGLGQPGTSILSPEGIYDAAYVRQSEGGVRGAAGTPQEVTQASSSRGSYMIYRHQGLEVRINIRSGEVYEVSLYDISGATPTLLKRKSGIGATFP